LTKLKGAVVERIVAMMHEGEPQVTVKRDVRLPTGETQRQT
jgi:hypothetical protein